MERKADLLKMSSLLEECMNAYKYAVEVVQKESKLMFELCDSCADVCRTCARECLELGGTKEDKVYQMCMDYSNLCEQLKQYESKVDERALRKSV
ncbi:hypothetical protein [Halobacillus litoralis]|uniref:hypothetical protein n=1 Tax=Halobacillus litoralis TaxID=45668 RepID=UPI001CFD8A8E|nr:hypothetical protein [Halobacillus litoralis]